MTPRPRGVFLLAPEDPKRSRPIRADRNQKPVRPIIVPDVIRVELLSLKQDAGHRHARLFRWVEQGVLPWPIVASLDPA